MNFNYVKNENGIVYFDIEHSKYVIFHVLGFRRGFAPFLLVVIYKTNCPYYVNLLTLQ